MLSDNPAVTFGPDGLLGLAGPGMIVPDRKSMSNPKHADTPHTDRRRKPRRKKKKSNAGPQPSEDL